MKHIKHFIDVYNHSIIFLHILRELAMTSLTVIPDLLRMLIHHYYYHHHYQHHHHHYHCYYHHHPHHYYYHHHHHKGISDEFSDNHSRPFTDAFKYLQSNVRKVVTQVSEMAKKIRYIFI
jgi:hypothetical protein